MDVGCKERRIVSQINCVVGTVSGDDSMTLFPINLFWVLEDATKIEVHCWIPAT